MINYFNQHPQIFLYEDEIHFFDSYQYLKGKEYYENIFKKKMPKNKNSLEKKHHHIVLFHYVPPEFKKCIPPSK